MNRNEFYKQLMSEYTFDADKVRENAKRGKKRQKLTPLYVGMSAAAAAMVVTVGTIAMTNLGRNDGVSLTDTGLTTLSASDRLSHALQQLEQERESSESKDFLVTFAQPLTPAQAQSVLTAGGNIPVKQLYLSDGSRVSDADSIGGIFTGGGDQRITGAAVYCSGSFAAELQDNPEVFLIEVMEASDFENAAPVDIAEISTGEVTLPPTEVTEPGRSHPSARDRCSRAVPRTALWSLRRIPPRWTAPPSRPDLRAHRGGRGTSHRGADHDPRGIHDCFHHSGQHGFRSGELRRA